MLCKVTHHPTLSVLLRPAATAAHTRYLSSLAAATLHGKTQGFVLRLPPQNIAHATFMQPLQCDLQPQIQETHRPTHTGRTTRCRTQRRNQNDRSRNCRTHEVPFIAGRSHFTRKNTRFRAPASSPKHSPCNIHATHTGHRNNHSLQNTEEEPKRPQPQLPHTRGTFHRRPKPLYTEKHKVSCPGFLPKTKPMQHACSHYNAICNHRFKKRIDLRTQEQPLVAEHQNDRSRNRGTFHRRLQPLYTKNTRFRAPASSPKHSPCNIHAAIPVRSATTDSRNA